MLLSCTRELISRISFFTYRLPDRTGRLDAFISRRLAKQFKLKHRLISAPPSNRDERAEWLYKTGYSVRERRGCLAVPMVKQLEPRRGYLMGLVAELGRGFYWRYLDDKKKSDTRKSVDENMLLTALGTPDVDGVSSDLFGRGLTSCPLVILDRSLISSISNSALGVG
jgi:hypothetical protein